MKNKKQKDQKIEPTNEEYSPQDNVCECDDCECESCECEETSNQKEDAEVLYEDGCGCGCVQNKEQEYLNLLKVVQADFDNYRKRSVTQIEKARTDGIAHAVEIFLPSLDVFKTVKPKIKDDSTREGIEMIEKQIRANLLKLGVEKIEAIGKHLDPNLHNAVAIAKDESKEDGIILDEFQAGYRLGDKIIRYSQVLVNKL